MEKPQALKVMGIILIVFGAIRLFAGIISVSRCLMINFLDTNFLTVIFLENFVCGIIILISGILLLKGKETGRILFVIASIIAPVACIIFLKSYGRGLISMIILILILYLWPSIKEYFKSSKEQ